MAAGQAQLTDLPGGVLTRPGADQDGLTQPARTQPARTQPASRTTAVLLTAAAARQREETLVADLDLLTVAIQRRHLDPTGHYNRPDVFRLHVDTSPRPAVIETSDTSLTQAVAAPQNAARQNVAAPQNAALQNVAAQHVAAQNSE